MRWFIELFLAESRRHFLTQIKSIEPKNGQTIVDQQLEQTAELMSPDAKIYNIASSLKFGWLSINFIALTILFWDMVARLAGPERTIWVAPTASYFLLFGHILLMMRESAFGRDPIKSQHYMIVGVFLGLFDISWAVLTGNMTIVIITVVAILLTSIIGLKIVNDLEEVKLQEKIQQYQLDWLSSTQE